MPQDAEAGGCDGQTHCKFSVRNVVAGCDGGSLYGRSGVSRKAGENVRQESDWGAQGRGQRSPLKREDRGRSGRDSHTQAGGFHALQGQDALMGSALPVTMSPRAVTSLRGSKGLVSINQVSQLENEEKEERECHWTWWDIV